MATIKAIAASSIHQIQSGQVIVDLTSVVKELVENALDAQATSIEVRFKNHGLDSVEVQDNGSGIAPDDFETVARKHFTSKLSDYDDLDSLKTFGFRGEALSSLCALSDFHVVTATAGPKGSRLEFEVSGALKSTSVAAAQKGTTVIVEKLFKNLPVRRRELEKNVKREYGKVLNFLQAYACISTNVRFSVSNLPTKGQKTIVFSTKSNPTTKDNIMNVYGAKTLLALVSMDLKFEMQSSHRAPAQAAIKQLHQENDASRQVQIQGHISKPVFGEGRQAPDRQMFFVNSRPCQLPQVAKAINEVYKSFNMSQSPFVFANLIMNTNAYDVNVSPDKRTILLHDQSALLDSLKEALTDLFEQQDQTMPASQLQKKTLPKFKQPALLRTETSRGSTSGLEAESQEESLFVETNSVNKTQQDPGQLIYDWAGQHTENRQATQTAIVQAKKNLERNKLDQALAKGGYVERRNDEEPPPGMDNKDDWTPTQPCLDGIELADDVDVAEDSQLPPPPPVPREVQDFNARILSQRMKQTKLPARITTETVEFEDERSEADLDQERGGTSDSEDIPSILPGKQTAAKPGPVQNAFDRMRPKRSHPEVATVAVGDQTLHMTMDGPESKKRRMHTPNRGGRTRNQPQSSAFTSALKMFAAAGSQMAEQASQMPTASSSDDEVDYEERAEESEDGLVLQDDRSRERTATPPTQGDDVANSTTSSRSSAAGSSSQSADGSPSEEDHDSDGEYLDESDKRAREDAKIAQMIQEAEDAAATPTEETLRRASQALRANSRRKDAPFNLEQTVTVSVADLIDTMSPNPPDHATLRRELSTPGAHADDIASANAEAKLSLTISKPDFADMRIVGQFNLGFILAIRRATKADDQDHLFIIDQHAADEKFNFERLSASTTLAPQRLVTPKDLQLSAVEEELISANSASLIANGFEIDVVEPPPVFSNDDEDTSGDADGTRRRFRLLTLPTSKETTFSISDLEELLHLLSETSGLASTAPPLPPSLVPSTLTWSSTPAPSSLDSHSFGAEATQPCPLAHRSAAVSSLHRSTAIVRPSRVRKMLAMRACRSSIMVGKNLTRAQMGNVVRHMGEMERPWNCPHGRPTMRHLAGLGEWGAWDRDVSWGREVDWVGYGSGR